MTNLEPPQLDELTLVVVVDNDPEESARFDAGKRRSVPGEGWMLIE